MASQYDIKLDQGATFEQAFVWNDVGPPKVPIDLTNYTARMQVRKSHEESDTILDVDDTDPEIALGGSNGTITLLFTDTVTAAFPAPFKGVYDLELIDGSDVVTRLLEGEFFVTPEVTRAAPP